MPHKDAQVWKSYTRGVTPVKKTRASKTGGKATKSVPPRRAKDEEVPLPVPRTAAAPLRVAAQLERKREKSLRQGALDIEGRLDLHGMTQDEAFAALARFLRRSVKAHKRHLLIITGKGKGGAGVLRQKLPDWLAALPEASSILALRPASIQHGGSGAFYVLLRKPKAA